VLIISTLIAIAISTFLGSRERAMDRAAQVSLKTTVTTAKTIFTDEYTYQDADLAEMKNSEPALEYVTTDSTGPTRVSVEDPPGDADVYLASVLSQSKNCWFARDDVDSGNPSAGTRWAVDDDAATATAPGGCVAARAVTLTDAQFASRTPGAAVDV
jgi:type II secretory pathway pseudopilin PulG